MTPDGKIKLVSQLLDLPLLDSDGKYCGIVDDVELAGRAGGPLKLKALLVGPGAYGRRMPGWAMGPVRGIAGDALVRVPIAKVRTIGAVVKLEGSAADLGLDEAERRAAKWIPNRGAL